MGRVPSFPQNDNGIKHGENRTTDIIRFCSTSQDKCETVLTFGEEKQKVKL